MPKIHHPRKRRLKTIKKGHSILGDLLEYFLNTLVCILDVKNKELFFNIFECDASLEIMSEALPYRYKEPERVFSLIKPDETIHKINQVGMILRTRNDKANFLTLPGKHIADFPQIDFSIFANVYFYVTTQKRWFFLHDGMPISLETVIRDWRKFNNILKVRTNLLTKEKLK